MSSATSTMHARQYVEFGVSAIAVIFTVVFIPTALYIAILVPHWRSQAAKRRRAEGRGGDAAEGVAKPSATVPIAGTTLTFRDVVYSVPRRKADPLIILQGVSGVLPAGSLTAIMGPSGCGPSASSNPASSNPRILVWPGLPRIRSDPASVMGLIFLPGWHSLPARAGKSTLLDCLADAKRSGLVTGDIRVNGVPRTEGDHFRSIAAYVMQSDNTHTVLTVRETLEFAAALRLPASVDEVARRARVEETLHDTDLLHVADTRVGDDVSGGLSGGQRRRVTVAIELINQPALLFLDEPTSGLDAYGALQVCHALRKFGDRGQTIACTIHQPRHDIFLLFDQLMLMSKGQTMFFGPIADIFPYFSSIGVPCDPGVNPADFIVDLTHSGHAEHEDEEDTEGAAEGAAGPQTKPPSVDEMVNLFSDAYMHTCACTYAHVYVHACTRAYTHAHGCMHTGGPLLNERADGSDACQDRRRGCRAVPL